MFRFWAAAAARELPRRRGKRSAICASVYALLFLYGGLPMTSVQATSFLTSLAAVASFASAADLGTMQVGNLNTVTGPPPLIDSPKCPGCSLAGICLPDETLAAGDKLLVLGTPEQIRHFKEWLREHPEDRAAPGK